jgi:hypothetical protein
MGCEDGYEGCGVRRRTQLAGVGAVLVGLAAAASGQECRSERGPARQAASPVRASAP